MTEHLPCHPDGEAGVTAHPLCHPDGEACVTAHPLCHPARAKLVSGSAIAVVMHAPRAAVPPARAGITLVELLVAIVIVGLLAGVAGLAARHAPMPNAQEQLVADVARARRTAIRDGRATTIELRIDGELRAVTARPDGQVIADAMVRTRLELDRLTGTAFTKEVVARAR